MVRTCNHYHIFVLSGSWNWFLHQSKGLLILYSMHTTFISLFVFFSFHSVIFTHLEKLPLPVKGCYYFYARHLWPLSSEGSLACLTWHGASAYNGKLLRPVTLIPNVEQLAVELSRPFLTTIGLSRSYSNNLCYRRGSISIIWLGLTILWETMSFYVMHIFMIYWLMLKL